MPTSQELLEMMHELEEQLEDEMTQEDCEPPVEEAQPLVVNFGGEYISIGVAGDDILPMLVEPDTSYWMWLRLAIMRLLSHAYLTRASQNSNGLQFVARQIGIENARHASTKLGLNDFVGGLKAVGRTWAQEVGDKACFPMRLQRNIELIGAELGLNTLEREILGLSVLVHAEPVLDNAFDLLGSVRGIHIPRILALVLDRSVAEVEKALLPDALLAKSGMLSVDLRLSGTVSSRLDLISRSFANRMVQDHADIFSLLQGLVDRPAGSHLEWSDFEHMQEQLEGLEDHLRQAVEQNKPGVNILFYGHPGTGKTQLARLLASTVGYPLVAVSGTDPNLFPISAATRTKMFRLAQSVFGSSRALVLLDECEEIFSASELPILDNDAAPASKSWLTQALEVNPVPTIWICNSIKDFDPAYIRRFDYCVKFSLPAAKYRRRHLQSKLGSYLSESVLHQMSKHVGASPALITRAAEIVSSAGAPDDHQYKGRLALQLLNQKFAALGYAEALPGRDDHVEFRPECVNAGINLEEIACNLASLRQGRICVYGPPGTGKTAFGHWLADKLGMPHLAYRASDLLAPHVGETEQKIAQAFVRARAEGGVLQFDEVDTFLAERQGSRQGWEVSMVNEMLVQMEAFQGIFIASTNIFERLDEASLRRFDLVVGFDFLRGEHSQRLFLAMCEALALDDPGTETLQRLKSCNSLTPGDFHQQRRQSKFYPPKTSAELAQRLMDTSARKHAYRKAPIGFSLS